MLAEAEQRSYCPHCNAVFRAAYARCPLDGSVLADLAEDPLVGTTLDGRYEIEECIGEGGMGRVYRAKHPRMSRYYAVKVLFGDHAGDKRMRSRFAREAEGVCRLSHTNVISVTDFGETEEGLLYLVMDLAPGRALAELVNQEGPLTPSRVVSIMHQLAKGLAHAHDRGLVHRDFKGENVIMVREDDGSETPKIVDFGICMIVEDSPAKSMLTSNGMVMGTPAVMAPEQASGDHVDNRTDLFSLGILGYQMLSGVLPFEGTPLDMARKNLYEPIPPIYERCGIQVPPALEAIITKLTEKKPENRYQRAQDVVADLEALFHSHSWAADSTPGFSTPMTNPGLSAPVHRSGINGAIGQGAVSTPAPSGIAPYSQTAYQPTPIPPPQMTDLVSLKPAKKSRQGLWITLVLLAIGGGAAVATMKALDKTKDLGEASKAEGDDGAKLAGTTPETTGSTGSEATGSEATGSESASGATNPRDEQGDGTDGAGLAADAGTAASTDEGSQDTSTDPGEDETASTEEPTEPKRVVRNRNNKGKNRNRQKTKPKPEPQVEEALVDKIKVLYRQVGALLDSVERQVGKGPVVALRQDYLDINYMSIFRDPKSQPRVYEKLRRIKRKLNSLKRNR